MPPLRPTPARARYLLLTSWVWILAAPVLAADPPQSLVIAAYQGPCADGDFPANLATARQIIANARARGAHFLCFPETFLSGYVTRQAVDLGARTLDDPAIQDLILESKNHDMVILIGIARKTAEGTWNSILVIQSGKLLGIYDKILLTGGDRDALGFLPGRSLPTFEAHGTRFAVIVCHDSSFPHVAMAARLKGAQILFSPLYNFIAEAGMDDHRRWTRNTHVGLACHFRMVVVRANVVVTTQPHAPGYGDSIILSPKGEPLAEAGLFRTALISAAIPRAMLNGHNAWARDSEVPDWLRQELADALMPPQGSPATHAPKP